MAFERPVLTLGFKAAADLSALQFTFVKCDSSGNVVACAATTDLPIGVLQNAPVSGDTADVMIVGVTKVKTAAATAVLSQIGTDASGLARINVPGTDTTKYIVGQVIGASAATNGIATATINCLNPHRGA